MCYCTNTATLKHIILDFGYCVFSKNQALTVRDNNSKCTSQSNYFQS